MNVSSMGNWFGADRMVAEAIGVQVGKQDHVTIPFMGGGSALQYIETRGGIANDLHRHMVNLARVIREPELRAELIARLDATLFHTDELADAQARCIAREQPAATATPDVPGQILIGEEIPPPAPEFPAETDGPDVAWAHDYFICSWMARGGNSGTRAEFYHGLSFRWTSGGGDSCRRFRSATESLDAWGDIVRPWNFICRDAFDVIEICQAKDLEEIDRRLARKSPESRCLYIDAPWPELGKSYKHSFDEAKQRRLAGMLKLLRVTRVVVRYGDHPLIRELYPEPEWYWHVYPSRNQGNNDVAEVLLINGSPYAARSRSKKTSRQKTAK